MHLSRRLVFSLLVGVTALSMVFGIYQGLSETHALKDQVVREAPALAASQQRPVLEALLQNGPSHDLETLVNRFEIQDHQAGIAVYDANGQPVASTAGLTER